MFELTIKEKVYKFNFGMGFLREANKRVKLPVDGLNGVEKNIGLQYMIACLIDNDIETLVDVLDMANKGFNPRVTRAELDSYVENEETDVDKLFEDVLDFLKNANVTRKAARAILETVEAKQNQK